MSNKIQDIVYTEKYTLNGEENKKYTKVGILMTKEDGSQSINMFGSWLNIYDQKPREEKNVVETLRAKEQKIDVSDIPF